MSGLFWPLFGFACGALPFSVWLGRLFAKQDVRSVGDGNPGATNALRLGGWRLGLAVLLLDVTKGALPVGLANFVFHLKGWELFLAALAPSLGHAFSPLLHGRGGKALAVTLGVWIGLTLVDTPVILLLMLVFWYAMLNVDGWAVLLTAIGLQLYLLAFRPEPIFLGVGLAQLALVVWKHRADLARRPGLRDWLRRRLRLKPPRSHKYG